MSKGLIGVDEVGRGPLAGPVAVGAVFLPAGFAWSSLPPVKDSKALSERRRLEIVAAARQLQTAGQLHFAVSLVSPAVIDRLGINRAIALALERSLTKLQIGVAGSADGWSLVPVRLDGGLKAPAAYQNQETIIRGDALEPAISLAAILAKVKRDTYMRQKATESPFAAYHFSDNVGYGTKAHLKAIKEHGLSPLHRRSFCRRLPLPLRQSKP